MDIDDVDGKNMGFFINIAGFCSLLLTVSSVSLGGVTNRQLKQNEFSPLFRVFEMQKHSKLYEIGFTKDGLTVKYPDGKREGLSPEVEICSQKPNSKTEVKQSSASSPFDFEYNCLGHSSPTKPNSQVETATCGVRADGNLLKWKCQRRSHSTADNQNEINFSFFYATRNGLENSRKHCPSADPQSTQIHQGVFEGFYRASVKDCQDLLNEDEAKALKNYDSETLYRAIEDKMSCKSDGSGCQCFGAEVLRRQPGVWYLNIALYKNNRSRCNEMVFFVPAANPAEMAKVLRYQDVSLEKIIE